MENEQWIPKEFEAPIPQSGRLTCGRTAQEQEHGESPIKIKKKSYFKSRKINLDQGKINE